MKSALVIASSLFIFSCGIKGPPLPPIDETTIQQQKAVQAVNTTAAPLVSADSSEAKKKNK